MRSEALAPLVAKFCFGLDLIIQITLAAPFQIISLYSQNSLEKYPVNILTYPCYNAAGQETSVILREQPSFAADFKMLQPKCRVSLEGTQTKLSFQINTFINTEGYTRPRKKLLWYPVNMYCISNIIFLS